MISSCYICSASVSHSSDSTAELKVCCGKCSDRLWKRNDRPEYMDGSSCRFTINPQYQWAKHIADLKRNPPCSQCGEIHD